MKKTEQQVRDELAAAKSALRCRKREEQELRQRLAELARRLSRQASQKQQMPPVPDYCPKKELAELLADVESKQATLAWNQGRLTRMSPDEKLAEKLFEEADAEFMTARRELPGPDYLQRFAKSRLLRCGLPPERIKTVAKLLSEHYAKQYIARRKELIAEGLLTEDHFFDPFSYGKAPYVPDGRD